MRVLVIALCLAACAVVVPAGAFAADESNSATQTTVVDNSGAQSAGLITGPLVIPINLGIGGNLLAGREGRRARVGMGMGMLGDMGMGSDMGGTMSNSTDQTTVVDNHGAQSAGLITGPIVVPINGLLGLNLGL